MEEFENVELDSSEGSLKEYDDGTVKKPRRGKRGKVVFIFGCVFFAIALVTGIISLIFWAGTLPLLLNGQAESLGQALGEIFLLIYALVIYIVSVLPSIVAIALSALSIKHFKVQSIVLLSIISVIFLTNTVCFFILLSKNGGGDGGTDSTQSAMLAANWIMAKYA